ncbi:hypothetical protein E4U41_001004 [Claviceps citrina]|nr:hypothetical protein E4U41_001004 [Claviceps citrina]
MPLVRATPESKRRVRTGCDENKPSCTSCQARRVQCEYPDLQFIPRTGVEAPASQRSYPRIKFVNEPLSPISKASQSTSSHSSSPAARATPLLPTPASITIDSLLTTTLLHEPQKQPSPGHDERVLLRWEGYFDTGSVSEARRHAALLRHFRYKIAPWMEAGDARGRLGAECMFLAQEHPSLERAILDVAREQIRVLRRARKELSACYHGRERTQYGQGSVGDVADSLQATGRYLCAGAETWREISREQLTKLRGMYSPSAMTEPLQTLMRLHSRFDLASSVTLRQAPCTSVCFYARNLRAASSSSWDNTDSPSKMYDWSLHHLTLCLYLTHDPDSDRHPGQLDVLFSQLLLPDDTTATAATSSQHMGPHAKWLALWKSCQTWRARRPLCMRPIVDIGTMEAGQMQTDGSSFPIQLYTSALAVQANIFYHTTSLLLLLQKPRLLKLAAAAEGHHKPEAVYTSQGWHAQHIAGVASTNEFAEQWDPIVFAALVLVGRSLTHQAQQRALRACLGAGGAVTGLMMEDGEEMRRLEEGWRVGEGLTDELGTGP